MTRSWWDVDLKSITKSTTLYQNRSLNRHISPAPIDVEVVRNVCKVDPEATIRKSRWLVGRMDLEFDSGDRQ